MKTIQELAQMYSAMFVRKTRDNGDTFYCASDDADENLISIIHAAHNDREMLPDDYHYEFTKDALDALSENEDIDDARQSATEADSYTSNLTKWLNSRNDRVYYLTEALEEFGCKDGFQALSTAQTLEKEEVFNAVVSALESIEIEDEEEATHE
jgi:hypothetical protein